MISILIASYGHEKYIQKTLDSIVEDDFEDKEVIIINDGSPDNSGATISKWVDENKDSLDITYIDRENKGLNATLNELISLAKGEYFALLDSDDFLLKGGLKKRYEFLKKHSDKKVVFGDAIMVNGYDEKIYDSMFFDFRSYPKDAFDDENMKKTLLKRFTLAGPIYLMKKDIVDEIGLYDESYVAGDMDYIIRALSKNYLCFLDERVGAYRFHDTNQSLTGISPKLLVDSAKSFWKNRELFPMEDRPIILWNIFKFLVRAMIVKFKK